MFRVILNNNLKLNRTLKLNNSFKSYSTVSQNVINKTNNSYNDDSNDPKNKQRIDDYLQNKLRDFKKETDLEKKMVHFNKVWRRLPESLYIQHIGDVYRFLNLLLGVGKVEEAKSVFERITNDKIKNDQELAKKGKVKVFIKEKREIDCLVSILNYYLKNEKLDELEQFLLANAQTYMSFFEIQVEFKEFLSKLSKVSFKRFSELVYNLYNNSLVSVKSSINILVFSIEYDPSGNTFNSFYQYHKNNWGLLTIQSFSDLLPFLLIKRQDKILNQILDDMIGGGANFRNLEIKFIHHMLRLFYRSEKDQVQLKKLTDKVLYIASQQNIQSISYLLYFYSSFYNFKEVSKEQRINLYTMTRVNHDLLNSFPDVTKLKIINYVISLLLASNQYHKALVWYSSISNSYGLVPNYLSTVYFTIYHQDLLESHENGKVKLSDQDIEKHKGCLEFWNNHILNNYSISPSNKDSSGISVGDESVSYDILINRYREFKSKYPEILDGTTNLSSSISKGKELRSILSQDIIYDDQLITLLNQNSNNKEFGAEVYNNLANNYLKCNDLPKGSLLIEALVSLKNDSSNIISKLENLPFQIIKPLVPNKSDISFSELKANFSSDLLNYFIDGPEEFSENEEMVSNFKKLLFNMFYYKFNPKLAINGFINLIERKVPINYELLEQAVITILENKSQFDREIIKMPIVYSFVHKFTKKNPTYEDGFYLTLRSLIDSRQFEKATQYLEEEPFAPFALLQNTILERSRIILESISNKDKIITEISSLCNQVLSSGLYKDISFLLNPIIKNLIVTLPSHKFKDFERQVLLNRNSPLVSQLRYLDNQTLAKLIYLHKDSSSSSFSRSNQSYKSSNPYIENSLSLYMGDLISKELRRNRNITSDELCSYLDIIRVIKYYNTKLLFDSINSLK